jgi:hypothetical protein
VLPLPPQYKRPKALKTRGFQGFWAIITKKTGKFYRICDIKLYLLDDLKFFHWQKTSQMAAYYHILTPFRISIDSDLKLKKQVLDAYGSDFFLQSTKRIERFSPLLPNGERLDFSYTQETYALKVETIRNEFVPFATLFFDEWSKLYTTTFKKKFYATQIDPKELMAQITNVDLLLKKHPLTSRQLDDELKDLEENNFFTIENLIPQVVYHGYPIKTDKHTSLSAINFLHAYEKMDVNPDEYVAMFMLVDKLKEKYADKFVLAKYLFIAGY